MTYREFMMMPLGVQLDYLDENYILDEEAVQQFRYFAHVFDIKHGLIVKGYALAFLDQQIQPNNDSLSKEAYIHCKNPFYRVMPSFEAIKNENTPNVVELVIMSGNFDLYYIKEVKKAHAMAVKIEEVLEFKESTGIPLQNTIDAIKAIYDKYPEAHMTKEQMQHA